MAYIFAMFFWFIGLVIGSFGIVQIMIIVGFGIRYTNDLDRQGVLSNKDKILRGYIITILIWSVIIIITTALIYLFASRLSFVAYCIGLGKMVLLGLGRTGATEANIRDYGEVNKNNINTYGGDTVATLLMAETLKKLYKG